MLKALIEDMFVTEITPVGATFRLLLALLFGCMIGFERKRKGQMAGVRTFALISMGSSLLMILSVYVANVFGHGDPSRIAAQVVSGIGFLGAGAIIQMRGSVRGLTTAAGIWVSATIGMVVGAGLYLLALIGTLCVLFVLSLLESYEHRANYAWSSKVVRVKVRGSVESSKVYLDVFERCNVHVNDTYLNIDYENNYTIVNFVVLTKSKADFSELFSRLKTINETLSIILTNEVNN